MLEGASFETWCHSLSCGKPVEALDVSFSCTRKHGKGTVPVGEHACCLSCLGESIREEESSFVRILEERVLGRATREVVELVGC